MSNKAILCVLLYLVAFTSGQSDCEVQCHKCFTHIQRTVPAYYLYIMATIMLFMMFIIIGLSFMLCRQKWACSKNQGFVIQDSNGVVPLKMPSRHSYYNESTPSLNKASVDMVDMPPSTRIEGGVQRKPTKIVKKHSVDNLLLQDKINQIVQDTLLNNETDVTSSIKRLEKLSSHNVNMSCGETNRRRNIDIKTEEKYVSSPELDLYDSVPAPRKIDDEEEEIYANDIYQFPKPRHESVSEEETHMEPSYINATRFKCKPLYSEEGQC